MGTTCLTILLASLVYVQAQFPPNPRPQNPGGFPNQGFPPNNPGGGRFPGNPGGGGFPGGGRPGGGWPGNPGIGPGNPGFPVGGPHGHPQMPGHVMGGCLPGWTNFGNLCYKYFWQRLPYDEANNMCRRFSAQMIPGSYYRPMPGHLIVTKDMNHNKFQHNWLRYTGGGANKVWMGLAELPADPESNRYFWADGTEFFWTRNHIFNRFKPDQPQQNAHRQAVHSFNNRPDNSWVTTSVETEVSFICQYQYKI
ncbi:collectin-12-like [Lytechinus pictus]|uniref:collectin-12-like n=1 Tax=Lytechinus pictus TaxID=7653 RepID=UPI0030BA292B